MRPHHAILQSSHVYARAKHLLLTELELRDYKASLPARLAAALLLLAAWPPMDPTLPTNTGTRPAMSIVSSKGRSRAICRCRYRRNMNWSSTSKLRRLST